MKMSSFSVISICNYSTIIFSGNILVLLMVAIATDYWEYNGFNFDALLKILPKMNNVNVFIPRDTRTYLEIVYIKDEPVRYYTGNKSSTQYFYQPPVFATVGPIGREKNGVIRVETRIFVFYQYSNLFRDCNDLEDGVRHRLGIKLIQKQKCINFIFMPSDDYRSQYDDAVTVLRIERAAFSFAVFCILCMAVSLTTGFIGASSRRPRLVINASAFSLASGMCLLVAIALFNGKSHLQQRWPLLPHVVFPFKHDLDIHKDHSYGWSFVLAWICVALNFLSSFVWLYKSQYMIDPLEPSRKRSRRRSRKKATAVKNYNYYPHTIEESEALCDL
ncbi:uncharacterized protein LOC126811730 [Patella vulgata]|uniref:uncharacterized protein LOC126811730 n=1 Tax=Patella vulgata TaxID=6465 RepID=UPI0021800497|nr:uncharacterized protein LOC126811730 [Patella vulgata]